MRVYLSVHPVSVQGGHHVLQDLTDSLGHVVRHVVHSLHRGVGEETVLSKQGFHGWLKPFALYANLSWSHCSVTTALARTHHGVQCSVKQPKKFTSNISMS